MKYSIIKSLEILERTPDVLLHFLNGLSSEWITNNEGEDTWSVFDVVGHLLHGDRTDWMLRIDKILTESEDKTFTPFDRFAQFETSKGKTLEQLLLEFKNVRERNLSNLRKLQLTENDFTKTGIHPVFGVVTLSQLLSTWTVHDLNHLAQISRIMAKQYKEETGPWIEYLRILK